MIDRSRISVALLVVGALLLVAPAVVPVESFLSHEMQGAVTADGENLRNRGMEVIAYENLSERGKTLFERTLRNGGDLRVPVGDGAPDFDYRVDPETEQDVARRPRYNPQVIAIERPDDDDLPTLDDRRPAERRHPDETGQRETGGTGDSGSASGTVTDDAATETGESSAEPTTEPTRPPDQSRYNLLETRVAQPPLTDPGNLLRFLSVLVGVVLIGGGGYLRSRP